MQPLRVLTVPRLLAINAVVAGLEIAACVAFTFIPPLLLKVSFWFLYITYCIFWNLIFQAGFTETNMSIILGVAPFLALFTVISFQTSKWGNLWTPQVPRMGQISDSCTSRWGRRRPFISLFSLLLVFSLLLLFLGESLSTEARWLRMVRWNISITISLI